MVFKHFQKIVVGLSIGLLGCAPRGYQTPVATQAVIIRTVLLPQVPSGSALARRGDSLYIVSDDAPYIYTYNLSSGKVDSAWLGYSNTTLHRIPWQDKFDYEASLITSWQGRMCLFSFGSGTIRQKRECIGVYWLDGNQPPSQYDAHLLYNYLYKVGAIRSVDFNLEGAALTSDGDLILLNRSRQQLFRMRWTDFTNWLTTQKIPDVTAQHLPIPEGPAYTFSGAETLDKRHLVFTASQEATKSSQQDGAIMGSSLGVLERNRNTQWTVKSIWPMVDASGKTAIEKVESAIPQPGDKSGRKFIALTDNDDGQSKLLWIEVR